MANSKLLYKGFSFMAFLWVLFLRVAALIIIIFALPHYNENPVAIYEDRVELSTNSFASFILRSKDKTYYMSEIKKAYLPSSKISAVDFGLVMLVKAIGPRRSWNRTYPIYLEMINGKEERIDTSLDEDKRKKIVDIVNSLVS
jgi:hypothetical protein